MCQHAGRLIDGQKAVVLIENVEKAILRDEIAGRFGGRDVDGKRLPRDQTVIGEDRCAVGQDGAGLLEPARHGFGEPERVPQDGIDLPAAIALRGAVRQDHMS